MATYLIEYTSKAHRTFAEALPTRIVASHRDFDPSVPPAAIKVMRHYYYYGEDSWFMTGSGGGTHGTKYIRVVIEVMKGRYTADQRQDLMQRAAICCQEYEGSHAPECEIEVRVLELDEADVLRVPRTSGRS